MIAEIAILNKLLPEAKELTGTAFKGKYEYKDYIICCPCRHITKNGNLYARWFNVETFIKLIEEIK